MNLIKSSKFVKVMFGTNSGANKDLEYKLNEVNIAKVWNKDEKDPNKMGGFNFSTEDKILRWLVRGDTIYDVDIPIDAEIVDVVNDSAPHGVFRTNKIIIYNPRKVNDKMAMELYLKSNLPEKSYFKALAGCVVRGYLKTADRIIKDKINSDNIELAIEEYKDFYIPKKDDDINAHNNFLKYLFFLERIRDDIY